MHQVAIAKQSRSHVIQLHKVDQITFKRNVFIIRFKFYTKELLRLDTTGLEIEKKKKKESLSIWLPIRSSD